MTTTPTQANLLSQNFALQAHSSSLCIESEVSADDEDDLLPESLGDRLYALRDMVAPSTRRRITSTVSSTGSWGWSGLKLGGRVAFVVATAVLFYGVPFALATAEEAQIVEMEKEAKMQEAGKEVGPLYPLSLLSLSFLLLWLLRADLVLRSARY